MGRVTHFDLAIIGTGSGNMIVGHEFADRSVAILEHGRFGGTCLNVGCIPTKMFVYPADVERTAAHGPDLSVHSSAGGVDWPSVRDRVFARVDPIASGGEEYRREQDNVTVYDGICRFTGPRQIDTGTGETITADQVVIAAGSRVSLPEIDGLADVDHHTSDTIMRITDLPGRLAIVGGGFIAAEFAHVFSAYGSQVTQIHRGGRLLTAEDDDVSTAFTRHARQQWEVRLDTTVASVRRSDGGVRLRLSDGSDLETDALLVATGRVPNGDRLDLPAAGVDTDAEGVVVVDEYQRTSAPGVWALGDVANHYQLKHVANHEARVIRHNLTHPDDLVAADHRFVPSAVFTSPQIASVGLTEQEARRQGRRYVTKTQDYADVAYGWAMQSAGFEPGDHFVKLIADAGDLTLLGAHLIGPMASVLVQPLIQAMTLGIPAHEAARGQYWIHPALSEVVENALLGLRPAG